MEYLKDLNATQAYIRAGYNVSEVVAKVNGSRLLTNANVRHKIDELMGKRAARVGVCSDRVLDELQRLGYSDAKDIYNEDGTIKHMKEWPEDLRRAVASIEVVETFEMVRGEKIWTGYNKKVKFWDKPKSLELLGRHKKLFTDKVEHSGHIGLAELLGGSDDENK